MWIPLDLQATFSDYLCAEFQHWGLSQGGRWQCTSPGSQERRERRATTSTGTPSGPDPVCVPQGLAPPREGGGSDLAQLTKGSAGNRANQPRPTFPVRLGDPDGGGSAGAESAKVHLWERGDVDASMNLEDQFDQLIKKRDIAIFCSFLMDN